MRRQCNFGASCNRKDDETHTCKFSHPTSSSSSWSFSSSRSSSPPPRKQWSFGVRVNEPAHASPSPAPTTPSPPPQQRPRTTGSRRPCNFGAQCYRRNEAEHAAAFSHPHVGGGGGGRRDLQVYKIMVEVPMPHNMGHVVGSNGSQLQAITRASGAVCEKGKSLVTVKANSETCVQKAIDMLLRAAEMGHHISRRLVFTDYVPDEMIRFIKPTPALQAIIGYGAEINDPHILSKEIVEQDSKLQFTPQFQSILQQALEQYQEKPGRLKFQARYGKSVFFKLSDEAKNQPMRASTLVEHESGEHSAYRTSFTTGVAVHEDLHQLLVENGEPVVKESYNFKTIAKHEGKYYTINVNVYIDNDGQLVCESVSGKEQKLCIDQASVDSSKLDVRLSLQFSDIIREDHFLFPYAEGLFNSMHLYDDENGLRSLSYTATPEVFVYTIRHKKRLNYTYEKDFKIDVSTVRMVDYQKDLFSEHKTGTMYPEFDKNKTEVELSYIPWRKAFKHNKCLVGGAVGEYMMQKHSPQPWDAEDLCSDLDKFISVAMPLSNVIFAM